MKALFAIVRTSYSKNDVHDFNEDRPSEIQDVFVSFDVLACLPWKERNCTNERRINEKAPPEWSRGAIPFSTWNLKRILLDYLKLWIKQAWLYIYNKTLYCFLIWANCNGNFSGNLWNYPNKIAFAETFGASDQFSRTPSFGRHIQEMMSSHFDEVGGFPLWALWGTGNGCRFPTKKARSALDYLLLKESQCFFHKGWV